MCPPACLSHQHEAHHATLSARIQPAALTDVLVAGSEAEKKRQLQLQAGLGGGDVDAPVVIVGRCALRGAPDELAEQCRTTGSGFLVTGAPPASASQGLLMSHQMTCMSTHPFATSQ